MAAGSVFCATSGLFGTALVSRYRTAQHCLYGCTRCRGRHRQGFKHPSRTAAVLRSCGIEGIKPRKRIPFCLEPDIAAFIKQLEPSCGRLCRSSAFTYSFWCCCTTTSTWLPTRGPSQGNKVSVCILCGGRGGRLVYVCVLSSSVRERILLFLGMAFADS